MAEIDWTDRHEQLWRELVPAKGQASTVQGELIRITGRLADEAYRNGNCNWDRGHAMWCDYLERVLDDEATFSSTERAAIRRALAAARDYEHPDTSGHGGPLYLLSEMAVRWCDAHPTPIPHVMNRDLRAYPSRWVGPCVSI